MDPHMMMGGAGGYAIPIRESGVGSHRDSPEMPGHNRFEERKGEDQMDGAGMFGGRQSHFPNQ